MDCLSISRACVVSLYSMKKDGESRKLKVNLSGNLLSEVEIPAGRQLEEKMLLYVAVIGLTDVDLILPGPSIAS